MNRLPSMFVSHGAPTFATDPGLAGPLLTQLGGRLPKPKAVLVVSPHWTTVQAKVCCAIKPQTIHDFGGFPQDLYQLQYPALGHPSLAMRAIQLLDEAGWDVFADSDWGLDHGAWVPLSYLYPAVDVPVFQVSMPSDLTSKSAFKYGQALAPLASEGVLIVGSGSLTHNLSEFRLGANEIAPYVVEFVAWVRAAVQRGDSKSLIDTMALAPHAQRSHPSNDHLLPLMVALGAAEHLNPVTVLDGGVQNSVLSMESYVFGWREDAHSDSYQKCALESV